MVPTKPCDCELCKAKNKNKIQERKLTDKELDESYEQFLNREFIYDPITGEPELLPRKKEK